MLPDAAQDAFSELDAMMFGRRVRELRRERYLTLAQLGAKVGKHASYLSLVENGRREPTLKVVQALATAFQVSLPVLLSVNSLTRRSSLELELEGIQRDPLYGGLGLGHLSPTARTPDDTLEHIVALFREVKRLATTRAETAAGVRLSNALLRETLRGAGNYLGHVEKVAAEALGAVGYLDGVVIPERVVADLAAHFGFTLHTAQDLPQSVDSLADLRAHRIYLPPKGRVGPHPVRSLVLRMVSHFALGHRQPDSFDEFLRQRAEANYFAAAILLPETAVVAFLMKAKDGRDISIEDLRAAFSVSYPMAAHRFASVATHHLQLCTHLIHSDINGTAIMTYQNDGLPFPADGEGAVEGGLLCREWGARRVFGSADRFETHYQWTNTPSGMYWSASHIEPNEPEQAITIGTTFEGARYFRGRNTNIRATSKCPDQPCCRHPERSLAGKWDGLVWPSQTRRNGVFHAIPATFPEIDMQSVYEFLESREG